MIIVYITNSPYSLKGELSKWLSEINTGVYIGKVSATVRDDLWNRICKYVKDGQATMVYSTNNEQGFAFKVHNTSWNPIDYDGITLMKRPLKTVDENTKIDKCNLGFSNASKYQQIKKKSKSSVNDLQKYVIIDLETTGLDYEKDCIIEIGCMLIENNIITKKYECLIKQSCDIPQKIVDLTGITKSMLIKYGVLEKDALTELQSMIKNATVVGYNINFDINFIIQACNRCGVPNNIRKSRDILDNARRKISDISDYKLKTVAQYFSLEINELHRALPDCELTYRIFNELNKM
jgi:CRISPR-associated protein Cas2